MSERFEDFMAGLVETAAANSAPGPAAARKRSKQRRARQGLAASALVLALLGGAGGVAAANLNHDSSAAPVGHSSAPTPAASASAPPSTAATTTTPSAAPSTTTNAPVNKNSNAAESLVPGIYNPGNWYNAGEVPLSSSTIVWVPYASLSGTRIGGDVAEAQPSSDGYSLLTYFGDACGIASLSAGTTATEHEYYTGFNGNGYLNTADGATAVGVNHLVYFYRDSTSVATAWNAIARGFTACAGAETGVDPTTGGRITGTTTRTASTADTQCWSNVTTPTGYPAGAGALDHVCLLRQGNVIAAVDVSVNFSKSAYVPTVDYSALDSTLLDNLAAGLGGRLYSGDSPVCASGDLKVALGASGTYGTLGDRYQILLLTNISGSTCTVEGYPAAMLVASSGKTLNPAGNDPRGPAKTYSEAQITLAPDATGSAILSWVSNASSASGCVYTGSDTLEVVAPYSTTATSLGPLTNACGFLSITPVQLGVVTP